MKKIFLSLVLILISIASLSFIDRKTEAAAGTYYASVDTSSGQNLINSLSSIITSGHSVVGYNGLKEAYKTTDVKPGTNYIWDMYSNYNYTAGSAFASSYKVEGDGYNREHSVPQSWFNEASPMKSDLFHVYPTDAKVNGIRSNYMFGETDNPKTTTGNGSKLGPSSHSLYSGTVFEPIDEYKGDFARTYFYMATRYKDKVGSWGNNFKGGYPYLTDYSISLFMKWHLQDPVSEKEINRNDAVYVLQKNRNPYIDHPEYANFIWGDGSLTNPDNGGGTGGETPEQPDTPSTPTTPGGDITGTTATLVKNVGDLKAGDKIIIAGSSANYALGTTQNNNNRKAVSITKAGDKLSFDSNVQVITLENGTKTNTFAFNVGTGYLYAASSSKNYLRTETSLSANSSWSISISSTGIATIKAQGTNSRNQIQYNDNDATNLLFSCYSAAQKSVSIYKVDTVETNYNQEVNKLFNKYYADGVYVKDTVINLNDAAKDDLINYFHANVNILQRTTYYNNNELWMSRGDGNYSYYGTNNIGLTNATAVTPYVTPSDAKVVITGTTMLDYYTTLEKIKTNDAVWKKEGNVYYTTDSTVLKYYLDFTAPCLLEDIFNSNYFTYEKATLEEVNNTLVLKLVINSEMHNALTSTDCVLSQATIRVSDLSKLETAKDTVLALNNLSINKNYTLPTSINGVSISWEGDNVTNNIVNYISPTSNFSNSLTATLTINELEQTVTINLIQLKYEEVTSEYLYTDFTEEEKELYNEYFGFVLPFIPNNDYLVDEFDPEEDGVSGLYFITVGNSEEEFNVYKNNIISLGFSFDDTALDDYGDTWYLYSIDELYLDMAYYLDEDETYIEIHLYDGGSLNDGETPSTSAIQAILNEAASLVDQEKLSGSRTVTGTVKEIKETYTTQYKNISFILTDGVADIYVHRAKGDCASTLKVGDSVTVTGEIINYKGTIEFQYPQLTTSSSGNQGGNGSADYSDVITNDGKGLPSDTDGVYDVNFENANIKNVTELGYYLDGCPTVGDVKVLVIPVEFSDRLASSLGYSLDKINKAFNGSGNDTDYRSVSEFYYASSYGKLNLDFVVLDSWFRPSNTSSYYAKQTMDYYGSSIFIGDQLIIDEALAYLESKMDLSQFDSDSNGVIDAVVLINTLEIDSNSDFNWAYRYWNIYTDSNDYYFEYDGVSANDYLWASYQFLYESGNSFDDKTAMNTYTFIHEFGHVLGADDYYDYAKINSPLNGSDMMDYMNGDHNPYTKFNYGWLTTSRLVVASDSITLTLNEFTSTGDTILIANNWDDSLGAFQEYYVLMYYRHINLNEDGYYFEEEGIIMYHVNASLYIETDGGEDYYVVYNTNSDSSYEYGTYDNLIELSKSSSNSYVFKTGSSSDGNLYDDLGNKIAYTFTVNSLTDTTATLTFTKNN